MRGKCVVVVVSSYWHNTLPWRTGNFLFFYIFKYSPIVPGLAPSFSLIVRYSRIVRIDH